MLIICIFKGLFLIYLSIKMALTHIFGDKPIPKVLDFLLVNQFWDYSLKDISLETDVSYRTLHDVVQSLMAQDIVVYTRSEGKAKMYQINRDNRVVKELQAIARENDLEYAEKSTAMHPQAN